MIRLQLALFSMLGLWLGLLIGDPPARASELLASNISDAYRGLRGAVVYLRTGNHTLAALELETAIESLAETGADGERPGSGNQGAGEPWQSSLAQIKLHMEQALAAIDAGEGKSATAALAPLRDLFALTRRQLGYTSLSDHVDRASASMEHLWHFRHHPPDLAETEAIEELLNRAGSLRQAIEDCRDYAPEAVKANAQFQRLILGTLEALDRVEQAAHARDEHLLINTLRELRSFETILWLEFG